ncbi:MAG: three component ABC system middle component [Cyanobacteria bacterium P01_G01_bin.54]
MSTLPWMERPTEVARLFNPAFLATLLWFCARGYSDIDVQGIPYPLIFVAIPVVLRKSTREKLPRTTRTNLLGWLANNPESQVRFAEQAAYLVPLIKEGVLFATNGNRLELSNLRLLVVSEPENLGTFLKQASTEVGDCTKKAEFVGRWFAKSGDYKTVMALWGVMP